MELSGDVRAQLQAATGVVADALSQILGGGGLDLDLDDPPAEQEAFAQLMEASEVAANQILELPPGEFGADEVAQLISLFGLQIDAAAQLSAAAMGVEEVAIGEGEWQFRGYDESPALVSEDPAQEGEPLGQPDDGGPAEVADGVRQDERLVALEGLAPPAEGEESGMGRPIGVDWSIDADRLEEARLAVEHPEAGDANGALAGDVEAFLTSTNTRVGRQLLEFASGPVVGEALALPVSNLTDAIARFIASPSDWVVGGWVRRTIGTLVGRAVDWLIRLVGRVGADLIDMVGSVLDWIRDLGEGVASSLLGIAGVSGEFAGLYAEGDEIEDLSQRYGKLAKRLDRAVGGGGFVLGILTANPVAGIVLGLVGATFAVWLGSDHIGKGGLFDGVPDLETDDLASLLGF